MAMKEQEEEKGQSVLCRVFDYLKNNPLSNVQAVAGALGISEKLCLRAILELEARGAVKHTVRPLDNNDNSCYYSACEREFNDDSEYCLCKTRRIITSDVESSDLGYWDTCCVCGKHIEYGFHYYNHYDGEDHDDIDV